LLVGYTIFADTSKNCVHIHHVKNFDDLETVSEIAWGPAVMPQYFYCILLIYYLIIKFYSNINYLYLFIYFIWWDDGYFNYYLSNLWVLKSII
jgi:hypothetical protein